MKMTTSNKLTKKELNQVFWRSFGLEWSWNYERQMNMSYCYSMLPVIKKLFTYYSFKFCNGKHFYPVMIDIINFRTNHKTNHKKVKPNHNNGNSCKTSVHGKSVEIRHINRNTERKHIPRNRAEKRTGQL